MTEAASFLPLDKGNFAHQTALCALGKAVCDLILVNNHLAKIVPDHPALKVIESHRQDISAIWDALRGA